LDKSCVLFYFVEKLSFRGVGGTAKVPSQLNRVTLYSLSYLSLPVSLSLSLSLSSFALKFIFNYQLDPTLVDFWILWFLFLLNCFSTLLSGSCLSWVLVSTCTQNREFPGMGTMTRKPVLQPELSFDVHIQNDGELFSAS
jgi:hypothetical protein